MLTLLAIASSAAAVDPADTPADNPACATTPAPVPNPAPAPAPDASPAPMSTAAPAADGSPDPAPAPAAAPPELFYKDLPKLDLTPGTKVPFLITQTEVLSGASAYATPLTEAARSVTAQLESLLPDLAASAPGVTAVRMEQLLLVHDEALGSWARGVLLDVAGGTAILYLVDHGRTGEVPADQMRLAHPDLAKIPAASVEIRLNGYCDLSMAHALLAGQCLDAAAKEPLELEIIGLEGNCFRVRAPAIDAKLRAAGADL